MSSLIRNLYFVPILIIAGIIFLYFSVGESSQIITLSLFIIACSVYGLIFRNRWVITLAGLFLYYFISFELQTVFSGIHSVAVISIFLSNFIIFLWYMDEIYTLRNIVTGFAISMAVLECFLALLFWPINLISRSMILVIFSFLFFELVDRSIAIDNNYQQKSSHGNVIRLNPWLAMRKELVIAGIIVVGIIFSSHWFIF